MVRRIRVRTLNSRWGTAPWEVARRMTTHLVSDGWYFLLS